MNSEKSSTIKIEKENDPPDTNNIISVFGVKKTEPEKGLGSFLVEKRRAETKPNISYASDGDSLRIKVFNRDEFSVNYPKGILSNFAEKSKKVLLDNFIYARTVPLAIFSKSPLYYQASKPFFKNFVDTGIMKDLPRISDETKVETDELSRNFLDLKESKITFEDKNSTEKIIPDQKTSDKKVILSLSFGRDSLLSFGVIKELGLECHPVFVNDMEKYNKNEFKIKQRIIQSFSKDQNQSLYIFDDDTDNIFRKERNHKKGSEELDSTNAMLSFALELIPLAYNKNAKYIAFGNERNLSDFFFNEQKTKIYPYYDQSSIYMKKKNECLEKLTQGNIQIVSFVEPLYNIAEVRVLHNRYPYLLKHLASCCSNKLKNERWCCRCSNCAKAFLFASAVNGNMKELGIKEDLFNIKKKNLFSLFSPGVKRIYEKPPEVREEQLLGFLLAYKNGCKGGLIDLFKKRYLDEALRREKELREKFFGIHSTDSIPKEMKNRVLEIYRQELKDLV